MLDIHVKHRIPSPNYHNWFYISNLSTMSLHPADFKFTAPLLMYVKIFIANLNKNMMSQDIQ